MSTKSKAKNAYYFFMRDWRAEQNTPHRSFEEIAADPRCNEEWKNLPSIRRDQYEALAKENKILCQRSLSKNSASRKNLREIEEQEKREEEFRHNMLQYVSSVVSMGLKHDNLETLKFLFIHVNWFYIKSIGMNKYEYGPAEFAVAEFSLKNGIQNVYHEILNITIPLGWMREAIETSKETHQIPVNFSEGESDFCLMYTKLVKLLESYKTENKFPPLFTVESTTNAVNSLLLMMTEAANRSIDEFQVYSLETLFAELRNVIVRKTEGQSIPLVIAEIEFGKDIFNFTPGAGCYFHKLLDNGSQYCSKSVVTRWGYTICDYCCIHMNIDMVEGVHYPNSRVDHQQWNDNGIDEVSARME
ncbi:protein maelstrom-like [Ceratina calcarata]|uniref:Protein maelstrom-like n=1 Tax=Ceratina calcarata TaxID=156304 RepID=A0AAJ7NAF4_9HYME|nr:protein maelstrom-like [Ceratina calcarata]